MFQQAPKPKEGQTFVLSIINSCSLFSEKL